MEAGNITTYFGKAALSNQTIIPNRYLYFDIHNSLIDASMGTPVPAVKEMIQRAKETGAKGVDFDNYAGRTVYAVLAVNINATILQEIFELAEGLKQLANSQGKQLPELFNIKGFEMHDLMLECDSEAIINGDVLYNVDYTRKLVEIGNYSLEEILELDVENITFGHVTKAKLPEWQNVEE